MIEILCGKHAVRLTKWQKHFSWLSLYRSLSRIGKTVGKKGNYSIRGVSLIHFQNIGCHRFGLLNLSLPHRSTLFNQSSETFHCIFLWIGQNERLHLFLRTVIWKRIVTRLRAEIFNKLIQLKLFNFNATTEKHRRNETINNTQSLVYNVWYLNSILSIRFVS